MSTYRSASRAPAPELTLRIRQTPLPYVAAFVAFLLGVGLLAAHQASRYAGIACRREPDRSGACTVRTASLFKTYDETIPLASIRGTRVERYAQGRSTSYRVVLDTTLGAFVLSRGGRRSEREVDAAAIDAFLRADGPGIFVERYGSRARAIPWLLGTLVLALGVGALLARVADLGFRVESERLVVRRRGLRGEHVLARLSLDEIEDAVVDSTDKDTHRLVLTTKLGERIDLEHGHGPGRARRDAAAERIRELLRAARSRT